MKFTDRYIQTLKATSARYIIQEANAHGQGSLGMRVSPNGHKAWLYTYRFGQGAENRVRRMTLGSYPAMSVADAHAACGEAMRLRERGIDPGSKAVDQHESDRAAPTVAKLAEEYLKLYATPRKRSAGNDAGNLKNHVLPQWGTRKAASIKRGDVARLLDGIVAAGTPIAANRTRAVLSKMFRWAVSREIIEYNPVSGVDPPSQEHARDRALSEAELLKLLDRLDTAPIPHAVRLAIHFLLLTGARVGEAAGATSAEIDENAATWTIPAERSKNKRAHRLPLSPQALEVLEAAKKLKRDKDKGAIFPGLRHGGPVAPSAITAAVKANLEHFGISRFTPHDLRRTVASGLSAAGVPRVVVTKVLNHIDSTVTGAVYDRHEYAKEMRAALDAWGLHIGTLASQAAHQGRLTVAK